MHSSNRPRNIHLRRSSLGLHRIRIYCWRPRCNELVSSLQPYRHVVYAHWFSRFGGLRCREANEDIGCSKRCPALYITVRRGQQLQVSKMVNRRVTIPFCGDQPFWGDMIARADARPPPIPCKRLTVDKLVSAIKEVLQPVTAIRAAELGSRIKQENGVSRGVTSFHDRLPMDQMRCVIAPERVAVWRFSKTDVRLSAMIAFLLVDEGLIDAEKLKL